MNYQGTFGKLQKEAKKRGFNGIADWAQNGPKDEYENFFSKLVKEVSTDTLVDWLDEADANIGYLMSDKEDLN